MGSEHTYAATALTLTQLRAVCRRLDPQDIAEKEPANRTLYDAAVRLRGELDRRERRG